MTPIQLYATVASRGHLSGGEWQSSAVGENDRESHAVRLKLASQKGDRLEEAGRKSPAPAESHLFETGRPGGRGSRLAAQNGRTSGRLSGRRSGAARSARRPSPAPPPAPPAGRKPGFYEAVAIYERGVQALQRHDLQGGGRVFRTVLERYPDERELLERARLYLRVCERETARQPTAPENARRAGLCRDRRAELRRSLRRLDHLQRALGEDPDSDHAHYIMAVALGMRGAADEALEHLRRAIAPEPRNRGLARQDPDLESHPNHERFRLRPGHAAAPTAAGRARRR